MGKKLQKILAERDQVQSQLEAIVSDAELMKRIEDARDAVEQAERAAKEADERFRHERMRVLEAAGLSDGSANELSVARDRLARMAGLPDASEVYQRLGTRYHGILDRFADSLRTQALNDASGRLARYERAVQDAYARVHEAKKAIPPDADRYARLQGSLRWLNHKIDLETPRPATNAIGPEQLTEARSWLLKLERGEVIVALPLKGGQP